jgi:hypothetical protein
MRCRKCWVRMEDGKSDGLLATFEVDAKRVGLRGEGGGFSVADGM